MLFDAETTQFEEVRDVLERTVRCADDIERHVTGEDMPIEEVRGALEREARGRKDQEPGDAEN